MFNLIFLLCSISFAQSEFTDEELIEQFEAKVDTCGGFYEEHGYSVTAKDDQSALQKYIQAYHTVNQHNSNPGRHYDQILNCFATINAATMEHLFPVMTLPKEDLEHPVPTVSIRVSTSSPDSYDRRDDNTTTPVKNQLDCGSCWAFTAMAALESKYVALTGDDLADADFSEQQLLDCTYEASSGKDGCNGGDTHIAWARLQDAQSSILYSEVQRPYNNSDGVCHIFEENKPNAMRKVVMKDPAYAKAFFDYDIFGNLGDIVGNGTQDRIWSEGAIAVLIRVEDPFTMYSSGIFDTWCSSAGINHAVALVGYTQAYFTAKNSWGTYWGESGYIRISRTAGSFCEYLSYSMWPLMECAWGTDSVTGKCVSTEPCDGCENNGHCTLNTTTTEWSCSCVHTWHGSRCDNDTCVYGTCQNAGTCNHDSGLCTCTSDEWSGERCELENLCYGITCGNSTGVQEVCNGVTGECTLPHSKAGRSDRILWTLVVLILAVVM